MIFLIFQGDCVTDSHPEYFSVNLWLFVLSQLLTGAGAAPLYTLGVTYLDENVTKKMSSVYLGKLFPGAQEPQSSGGRLSASIDSHFVFLRYLLHFVFDRTGSGIPFGRRIAQNIYRFSF